MNQPDQPRLSRRRILQAAGTFSTAALLTRTPTLQAQGADSAQAAATSRAPTSELATRTRRQRSYQLRLARAEQHLRAVTTMQPTNNDEERYPGYVASYSKALPHNDRGEVIPVAYDMLLAAIRGESQFTQVPLGGDTRLANPQAATAYQLEGLDSHDVQIATAPAFDSQEIAGELVELYWKAMARDVPFVDYGQEAITDAAYSDLIHFPYFANWEARQLFRGETYGDLVGPYISQFLTLPVPFGAGTITQMYRVPQPGDDYMTDYTGWLRCQNGALPTSPNQYDPQPRYLRNGRDLGEYVHLDFSYQAFLNAALILNSYGRTALSPANPYRSTANQGGFATFGAPDILSLVAQVANLALKAAWAQKWLLHRRIRPETFAGRAQQQWLNGAPYGIHEQLQQAQAPQRIFSQWGNYLLPQAYPEGCPTHPAYPSGHAAIAGACVTVLKAFYDETYIIPNAQLADRTGLKLLRYKNNEALTVGNELNKLGANIALGRNFAGVHWRSDGIQGLLLGEQVALGLLQDVVFTYPEAGGGFQLTRFDRSVVTIKGEVEDV